MDKSRVFFYLASEQMFDGHPKKMKKRMEKNKKSREFSVRIQFENCIHSGHVVLKLKRLNMEYYRQQKVKKKMVSFSKTV